MNQHISLIRNVQHMFRPHGEAPVHDDFHKYPAVEYSQSNTDYQNSPYQVRNLNSVLYRYRQSAALRIVDKLDLPTESKVLEIQCGSGDLTGELARRKYVVNAINRVRASLDAVHHRAIETGHQNRIMTSIGDVHALDFENQSFDLVIALGVIPWLRSPMTAMMEIMRVLKCGGYAIITVDNRWRLNHILDPRFTPLLSSIRKTVPNMLEALKLKRPTFQPSLPRMYSIREFDSLLDSIGLFKSAGMTIAFGPFTLMGKRILPDPMGQMLHRVFQGLADRNVPGIRSTGSHYIVLGQKRGPTPIQRLYRDGTLANREYHNN